MGLLVSSMADDDITTKTWHRIDADIVALNTNERMMDLHQVITTRESVQTCKSDCPSLLDMCAYVDLRFGIGTAVSGLEVSRVQSI